MLELNGICTEYPRALLHRYYKPLQIVNKFQGFFFFRFRRKESKNKWFYTKKRHTQTILTPKNVVSYCVRATGNFQIHPSLCYAAHQRIWFVCFYGLSRSFFFHFSDFYLFVLNFKVFFQMKIADLGPIDSTLAVTRPKYWNCN